MARTASRPHPTRVDLLHLSITPPARPVIHHVFANRSNAGDWLSALGIQRVLGVDTVTEHLCDAPFVEETLARLAACGAGDLIIVGGGGLFMDYFEPFWRGLLPIARRVPTVVWGVGVCDTVRAPSLPSRALLEDIVAACRLCVVRDSLTHAYIGRDGLPPPVACPAMNALAEIAATPAGVLLHADHYDTVGSDAFEAMERTAAAFARDTGRTHRRTNNILPPGRRDALDRIVALYASADLVLTSRLHGCIIAAALGRPFLAVCGDRKVDAFMKAAGLEAWLCSLGALDTLPERLHALDAARPGAPAFVAATREANRAIAGRVRALGDAPPLRHDA